MTSDTFESRPSATPRRVVANAGSVATAAVAAVSAAAPTTGTAAWKSSTLCRADRALRISAAADAAAAARRDIAPPLEGRSLHPARAENDARGLAEDTPPPRVTVWSRSGW